jgi:NAD(P)-dependent dehydrogenase (short-subunit alcohol dehydrogenase family)
MLQLLLPESVSMSTCLSTMLELAAGRGSFPWAPSKPPCSEIETNYFGPLLLNRAFAPVLAKNGGGAIINILSILSWVSVPDGGTYSASKAAAWALTNWLRTGLCEQSTQVLGVHAGPIDTDMASELTLPKVKPVDVVRQVLSALEAGREEVLADEMTRQVKAGLSDEVGIYLDFDPGRSLATAK